MSVIKDAMEHARSEAQDLHMKIEAAKLKHDVHKAGEQAKRLAGTLKTHLEGQHADVKQHVHDAISQLQDVAHEAASMDDQELKANHAALVKKAHAAIQSLGKAISSAA